MNEREMKLMRNLLGPALFTLGAMMFVLAGMTLVNEPPAPGQTGTGALAWKFVGLIGLIPGLCLGGGLAFLGGRLFLFDDDEELARNTLGVVLVTFGLAVLASAVRLGAGGRFGDALGGAVTREVHVLVGFLFGVVCLAAPVWFVWLRETALEYLGTSDSSAPERVIVTDREAGGLSAAEAEALLPTAETAEPAPAVPEPQAAPAKKENVELARLLEAQQDEVTELQEELRNTKAPSPYPEDVRKTGGVPEGTTPLVTDLDSHESPNESSTVQRWTPESRRLTDDALGADLVEAESPARNLLAGARGEGESVEDAADLAEPAAQGLSEEPQASVEAPTAPGPVEPPRPETRLATNLGAKLQAALETPGVKPLEREDAEATGPRPSWEQSSLFEEDEVPEEEAALTEPEPEEEPELAEAAELEEDDAEDDEEWEYEEEDEEEDPSAEYEYEEEEDEEEDPEAAEYEEYEEEDEEEEYEEDDEELDPAAEYEDEEEYEEDEDEELDPAAEYEEEDEEEYEDELDPAAELEEPEEEDDEEPVAEEREVVLTPKAPPVAAESEPETSGKVTAELVYESGVLFLERGRVAVSLLQREFGLDFDESCEVMDRLQEMGLIGPYVGGHRRDILLDRDQWLEKVTMP